MTASGRVLIDWGVDGFPESFLVDRSGISALAYWGAAGCE